MIKLRCILMATVLAIAAGPLYAEEQTAIKPPPAAEKAARPALPDEARAKQLVEDNARFEAALKAGKNPECVQFCRKQVQGCKKGCDYGCDRECVYKCPDPAGGINKACQEQCTISCRKTSCPTVCANDRNSCLSACPKATAKDKAKADKTKQTEQTEPAAKPEPAPAE
jgi:hypothetical protein